MEEMILSPIGLMLGIIAASAKRIKAKIVFGFEHKSVKQEGFYKKLHMPIQGRSPPLFVLV